MAVKVLTTGGVFAPGGNYMRLFTTERPSATRAFTLSAALCLFSAAYASDVHPAEPILGKVAYVSHQRDASVQEVRSIRRYILHNKRWSADAVTDVLVITRGEGRQKYEILNSTAKGLQREVIRRILEGEMDAAEQLPQNEMSPANYDTEPLGMRTVNGHECQAVNLIPKRHTKYLLEGWACIDTQENAIVHVEGRTAKSISFWIGRPYIKQDFRKVGSFWYSAKSQSSADVKLLGTTELTIEYRDYSITPKNGRVLLACTANVCSPRLSE